MMRCEKRGGHKIVSYSLFILVLLFLSPFLASGNGDHEHDVPGEDGRADIQQDILTLVDHIHSLNLRVIGGASLLITLVLVYTFAFEKRARRHKGFLFFWIALAAIGATIFLAGSTIYLNASSVTKGPVHWHADYEVWACGQKLDLIDPTGLHNRIGTTTLHEHGDDRLHVEGVVHRIQDASLGSYFNTVGARLTHDRILYPTNEGLTSYTNGDACPDGGTGRINVYVNGRRIDDPASYILSPEALVPPGDCIIIEFGPEDSPTTKRLCSSWAVKGWTYDAALNSQAEQETEQEHDEGSHNGHDAGPEKYGHLTTFGPGEAPHLHGFDLSSLEHAPDIAPDPSVPAKPSLHNNVNITLEAQEVISEIAPGITTSYWTYNKKVPGPFLRVREGDMIELTLKNHETSTHNHSIDLHAVNGPGGGAGLTNVAPGESKSFLFKALNPGLYVYHCATPNAPLHVAHGMYGLILVEPREGLPQVDKEFFLVQGELYTEGNIGDRGFQPFSAQKMLAETPEYIVFNGRVKGLVDHPLTARVGETVRLYVGNGGVSRISSFHVIGEIFDTVYPEASASRIHHVQTTLVPAGGATIVEFTVDAPGRYVLVDHALARIDRGAWGILDVSGPEQPAIFSQISSTPPLGGNGHGS